jgi:hypothetical protein
MKHAPRVVAEHPSGAARHGGNTVLSCPRVPMASSPRRRRPRTRSGAGFGRSTFVAPPAPESVALCLGLFTCLYRSGRARRVRPGGLDPSLERDLRIFGEVPRQRVARCSRCRVAAARRARTTWCSPPGVASSWHRSIGWVAAGTTTARRRCSACGVPALLQRPGRRELYT